MRDRANGESQELAGWRIDRRRFLGYGLAATTGTWLWASTPSGAAVRVVSRQVSRKVRARGPYPSHTVTLRRPDDLVWLRFEFFNLKLVTSGPPRLVRVSATQPTYVVVHFRAQNLAEQAYYLADPDFEPDYCPFPGPGPGDDPCPPGTELPDPPPVQSRLALGSRLAFEVPAEVDEIPYTPEGLLDWRAWTQRVVPAAHDDGSLRAGVTKALRAPLHTETAIEAPWWLLLSTRPKAGWAHALTPVDHGTGRYELWHTRLGVRPDDPGDPVDEEDAALRTVRAVWARDPNFPNFLKDPDNNVPLDGEDPPNSLAGLPFRMSLSPRDRYDLVVSSADFTHKVTNSGYTPTPVDVDLLMLTSLGAWMDVRGAWKAGNASTQSGRSLEEWRHRATLARDHYVRIVRKGYLFPYGHRASLIKITERVFETPPNTGRRTALLRQRYFILVRQPVKTFGAGTDGQQKQGRAFPFASVRFTTLVTPNLDQPQGVLAGETATNAFVPNVGGKPFGFHVATVDVDGKPVSWTTPVVFVSSDISHTSATMTSLRNLYNNTWQPTDERRAVDLQGQAVALAPSQPSDRGATDVEIQRLTLGAEAPDATPVATLAELDQPLFFPTLAEAAVRLAAVEALSGGPLSTKPVIVLDQTYVDHGFGVAQTAGEVFARRKPNTPATNLVYGEGNNGGKGGGVVSPNLNISGLSRKLGPVAGETATAQSGSFDPEEFFKGGLARLLGGVELLNIVNGVGIGGASVPKEALTLVQDTTPTAVTITLDWHPGLKGDPLGFFIPTGKEGSPGATLDLTAVVRTDLVDPGKSSSTVVGDLRHFGIRLLGTPAPFIIVWFDRLTFTTEAGQEPDVKIAIRDVVFDPAGPLYFIEKLSSFLDFGGSGPFLDVTPGGLTAGYSLALPNIEVGLFAIKNLSLSASLNLPFTGAPARVRFALCSRENPFNIVISIFGGGGFFAIGLGSDGVELLEVSLEFGGSMSLDIGVASGGVYLMAGIYIKVETVDNEEKAQLTGYVRLGGKVRVIGIITLSVEFYMSLTYLLPDDKVIGQAKLTVEIDVVLFSGSVTMEVERKYGGENDPTFAQTVSQAQWDTYCDAFESIGVSG